MRGAEWIQIAVFSFFGSLAWVRALPWQRRAKVTGISALGLGSTLIAALLLPGLVPPRAVSVVRDWLPAALVLVVYWQAGEFFTKIDHRFQEQLERVDARMIAPLLNWLSHHRAGIWILAYFELAYLLCYAMIPMSVATLYLLRLSRYADQFWIVVLLPAYISYGALPFLQMLPPRMLAETWLDPLPSNPIRRFNLWILQHASIHLNTFPSAHVAASTAAALVILRLAPWPVGLLFLTIAAGITFGTFAGRYHFSADAAAGSVLAVVVFVVARCFGI